MRPLFAGVVLTAAAPFAGVGLLASSAWSERDPLLRAATIPGVSGHFDRGGVTGARGRAGADRLAGPLAIAMPVALAAPVHGCALFSGARR